MRKKWLLSIPLLINIFSCEIFHTGGNPDEGKCSLIVKEHGNMRNNIVINCSLESNCNVSLLFLLVGTPVGYGCSDGFEYKFVQNNETSVVKRNYDRSKPSENTSIKLDLDADEHVRFSLLDINNVEKKYDIDLSGIIHSYTVRGDSVDVNVMKGCHLDLFSCKKATVYGSNLLNGVYTFSTTDGCKFVYSYDCLWQNQGSFETDELDIHAMIYWK